MGYGYRLSKSRKGANAKAGSRWWQLRERRKRPTSSNFPLTNCAYCRTRTCRVGSLSVSPGRSARLRARYRSLGSVSVSAEACSDFSGIRKNIRDPPTSSRPPGPHPDNAERRQVGLLTGGGWETGLQLRHRAPQVQTPDLVRIQAQEEVYVETDELPTG